MKWKANRVTKILQQSCIMLYYIEYFSTLGPALLGCTTRLNKVQKSETWAVLLRLSRFVKFESLWVQVTPQVFAPGPLTMPHSSHSISSKSLRLFFWCFFVSWVLMSKCPSLAWVHSFYNVAWRFFKSIIHSFGVLGTRTNVLFEALVAGHFPFLLLFHSPGDW